MNTIATYINELQKTKTLDEIAAQASVSKRTLKRLQGETIHTSYPIFKRILSLWVREVYLNG